MSIAFDTVPTNELRAQIDNLEEALGALRSRHQCALTIALGVELLDVLEELKDEWARRGVRHAIAKATPSKRARVRSRDVAWRAMPVD